MPTYEVVFNRHEKFSSDANVDSSPVENATVVKPVYQADIATVEADSAADAEHVVRVAYNSSTSDVRVVDNAGVVVAPLDKQDESVDAESDTESVADTAESVNADAVTVEPGIEPQVVLSPVEST